MVARTLDLDVNIVRVLDTDAFRKRLRYYRNHLILSLELNLKRVRGIALDFDHAHGLDELRRVQFDFRAALIDCLKAARDKGPRVRFATALINWLRPAAAGSHSRSDLHQAIIDYLQLFNDRLEGNTEPVEAIALVRRERGVKVAT